jgi:3-deoxy-manno-octulosonate cytidylyltransferase (CMP-KDO synthetase)
VPPVGSRNPFLTPSQRAHTVVVIPARFESTRLPGKPLADIAGAPMIEHVYRRAAAAQGVDAVVVAADDQRIIDAVQRFGGVARMTSPAHRTGTDRVAEVAAELPCEIVVNLQGDEPFIEPVMLADLVAPFADPGVQMSTLRHALADPREHADPHVVKVVVDRHGDALYFSRAPIPGARDAGPRPGPAGTTWKHVGVYGFRRDFLLTFSRLAQTPLELTESLEQLRALEHGYRIRTVATDYDSIGVDTPEDLERARRRMAAGVRA